MRSKSFLAFRGCVLSLAALTAVATSVASASTWSIGSLPPVVSNFGTGISCPAASTCFATADADDSSGEFGLVFEWNGTLWSHPSTFLPKGATSSVLSGISCTSSSDCTAVGNYHVGPQEKALIERLEGKNQWKIETGANGGDRAVSCASSTACTAVGWGLAQGWNGKEWTAETLAVPKGGEDLLPYGVSCTAANECTAVGYYFSGGTSVALAERWNGKEWSVQKLPTPEGAKSTSLNGVSCTIKTACTAVGNYYDGTQKHAMVAAWNGTEWSLQTVAKPAEEKYSDLIGVSCRSSKACTAVGEYFSTSGGGTLAEAWNGTEWSIQTTPSPNSSSFLEEVSCISTTECMAIGRDDTNGTSLAERYS